jgi:hypothetical protein
VSRRQNQKIMKHQRKKGEMPVFNELDGLFCALFMFKVMTFVVSLVCWKNDNAYDETMSLSLWLLIYSIWGMVTVVLYGISRCYDKPSSYCNDLCSTLATFCCGGMYVLFSLGWQGLGMYLTFSQSIDCASSDSGCLTLWVFSLINIVIFWLLVLLMAILLCCCQ